MASKTRSPQMGVPSTMNDSLQMNLIDLFQRGVKLQSSSEIVTLLPNGMTNERKTYSDLYNLSFSIAHILSNAPYNIAIGDRIGTLMWTNFRHLSLSFCIPCMGAILNPINIRLHSSDLSFIIEHTKHKILFLDEDIIPFFDKIDLNVLKLSVKHIIICGADSALKCKPQNIAYLNKHLSPIHLKCTDFHDFIIPNRTQKMNAFQWPYLDERSGAALLYTSGTTGNPKGSLYSHRSLYTQILALSGTDMCGLSGTDCVLSVIQIFHVLAGLLPYIGFMLGFKMLLPAHATDYNELLDFMIAEEGTFFAGVPTVVQAFRHSLVANPKKGNLMKLRKVICGGSSPPSDLIEFFWKKYRVEMIQAWGMSETAGFAYIARQQCLRSDLDLSEEEKVNNSKVCGYPVPGFQAKILGEDGKEVSNGIGELYVRGPFATKEYYGVTTPDKFKDDWLKTGDICSFTNRNQLVIHDRSKDMIKTGGEWLSSSDMENYIASEFNEIIEKCCVVAVEHELYRQRPVVIIQLLGDGCDNKDDLNRKIMIHLKKKYANFQLPDDIVYWSEIPLTGTGKLSKKDVRAKLSNDEYKLPEIPLRKTLFAKL